MSITNVKDPNLTKISLPKKGRTLDRELTDRFFDLSCHFVNNYRRLSEAERKELDKQLKELRDSLGILFPSLDAK